MNRLRILILSFFLAVAAALIPMTAGTATAAAPFCGITWGSLPKSLNDMRQGEIDTVRAGRHLCYDRVVVDIDGPPGGYRVEYVPQVLSDPKGDVVTVPGGARLQFVVQNPDFSSTTVGTKVVNVSGFRTLRSVVYAGSFEGLTTYGVGVRARLPFRVFRIPGGHGRIVLDVAHKW